MTNRRRPAGTTFLGPTWAGGDNALGMPCGAPDDQKWRGAIMGAKLEARGDKCGNLSLISGQKTGESVTLVI